MFDSVMGVGKTPQITADVTYNPYSVTFDDITPAIMGKSVIGANTTESGSLINVLNPNFDFIANEPYAMSCTGTNTNYITWDLGRSLFLRGVSLYYDSAPGTINTGTHLIFQYSTDGINWISVETTTNNTAAQVFYFRTYTSIQCRYIRFECLLNTAGSATKMVLRQLKAWVDSNQTFRTSAY